jgi:hypothetical protein
MNAVFTFQTADEMLVSYNVCGAILVHHLPREIIRAINLSDPYDRIAVTSVALPRRIVNENNIFYAGLMKYKLGGRSGALDQGMIPEDLSAVSDICGTHFIFSLQIQIFGERGAKPALFFCQRLQRK